MIHGKLILVGGAEDTGEDPKLQKHRNKINKEFKKFEILKELLPESHQKKIEIITTASSVPNQMKAYYEHAFARFSRATPHFIHIGSREEAHNKKILKRIEQARTVYFTGGNQFRLATILSGTPFNDIIKEKYTHDSDFIVAGTSAGAMALTNIMIYEGNIEEAFFLNNLKTISGLGFLSNCIIDTHFIRRGRFLRLAQAIMVNPGQLGLGLGEDSALVVTKGYKSECRGSGSVVIIDGKNIEQTNISEVGYQEPVYGKNIIVHLLVKGCRFSLKTGKLSFPIKKNQFA